MNQKMPKFEYRVVWKRRDLSKKERRYTRRATAERFAAIVRATTAEEVLRLRGRDPDEEACCNRYSCGCGGRTYGENEREYQKELPPLEYCVIEERRVGPWEAVVL